MELVQTKGPRTNNQLCQVVGKSHLNIFECVEVFQREKVSTQVSIQQLVAGAHLPHQKKKAIEKDQHIKELKERFSSNVISLSEYVAGMSQHINSSNL